MCEILYTCELSKNMQNCSFQPAAIENVFLRYNFFFANEFLLPKRQ